MITFNVIVERFREFADSHFLINAFSHGTPEDYDIEKFEEYPLMHLVYTGSQYGTGSKTYSMEVFVLGAGPVSDGKFEVARNVVSDSEQCLEDILADLSSGWNVFDETITLGSASVSPLMHEDHNTLVGAVLLLDLEVPYDHSSCFAPLEGVTEGSEEREFARRGILLMKEVDGDPVVNSVRTIVVPNDSLQDDGDGQVTLSFAAGGGLATRFKSVVSPVGSFGNQYILGTGIIQDFGAWSTILFGPTLLEVDGTAVVGVVVDPLGRDVQFTGMSTDMNVSLSMTFDFYQDPAIGTFPDTLFARWFVNQSGNLAFNDGETFFDAFYAPPIGEAFAEEVTLIDSGDVLVYPGWRMKFEFRSLYGTIKLRPKTFTLYVTQP